MWLILKEMNNKKKKAENKKFYFVLKKDFFFFFFLTWEDRLRQPWKLTMLPCHQYLFDLYNPDKLG